MNLSLGKCEIKMTISKSFHHSANSLHGSIYFKMLDDAAWGASNTYVDDVFLFDQPSAEALSCTPCGICGKYCCINVIKSCVAFTY